MATTTTNYGWTVPTSSDLVKNGATAISTIGQSVDTFLFRPFTRNAILNGSLDIWQRGTSFTTSGVYTADRWYYAGAAAGRTISRQSSALTGFQYCIRSQRDSGNTATNSFSIRQNLETVNSLPFAGQTVTVSFYARAGANYSATSNGLVAQLKSGTGTDQNSAVSYTGEVNVINQTATLTTSWQRFTYSATVGTTATELSLVFIAIPTGTAGAADYFDVTGVMLEIGSQASPYANATSTYQSELAACQRYYTRLNTAALANCQFGNGFAGTTSIATFTVPLPVKLRVTTGNTLDYSGLRVMDYGSGYTISTIGQYNSATDNCIWINANMSSASLTQYRPCILDTVTNGYLGIGAEL